MSDEDDSKALKRWLSLAEAFDLMWRPLFLWSTNRSLWTDDFLGACHDRHKGMRFADPGSDYTVKHVMSYAVQSSAVRDALSYDAWEPSDDVQAQPLVSRSTIPMMQCINGSIRSGTGVHHRYACGDINGDVLAPGPPKGGSPSSTVSTWTASSNFRQG